MSTFHHTDTTFTLAADRYRLQLNRRGSILSLHGADSEEPLLAGEPHDLWRARQNNGLLHFASGCADPDYQWDEAKQTLALAYTGDGLDVTVYLRARPAHVDLWAAITRHHGDVIKYFFLPDRIEFPVDDLNQFLYPYTWGVSLSPAFFEAYKRYSTGYPGPMDFMHLDSTRGQLSLYGIQPVRDRTPYADDEPLLVPGRLEVSGVRRAGPPHGALGHGWNVWIEAGTTFTTPRYRLAVGDTWLESVRAYGEANEITRTLAEKTRALTETLKQSYIVKFEKDTFAEMRDTLEQLPAPAVVHFAGYLPNGFDRFYPKHLPINPEVGTGEDFAALCQRANELGHLVMPYTNYTWWCYDTPYLAEHGEAALQKRVDGYPILEHYYEQIGYTASQWSPIHQRIMFDEVETLRDYGIHILSVDQMAARPFRPPFMTEDYWWDHNPACPTPTGAIQGIADAAKRLDEMLPLSTEVWENGPVDYLVNWCMQFCGFHIAGVPGAGAQLNEAGAGGAGGDVRFAPLIHALAHDKTIFTWHDLAPATSAWNDYRLSLSLLLGFQLIYVEGARGEHARAHRKLFSAQRPPDAAHWPDADTREWLDWLHQLSTHVVSRYLGQPLHAFRYLTPQVAEALYGEVTITANLGDAPHALSDDITIAPNGFYARDETVEVGLLDRHHSRKGSAMRILRTHR